MYIIHAVQQLLVILTLGELLDSDFGFELCFLKIRYLRILNDPISS